MALTRRQSLQLAGAAAITAATGTAAAVTAGAASAGASSSANSATCFAAYDNTSYTNVHIGQLAGFPTSSAIYETSGVGWEALIKSSQPPPEASYKNAVLLKASQHPGPVVIDFENLYLKSPDPAINQARYNAWMQITQWTQEALDAYDPGRKFGIFGFSNKGYLPATAALAKNIAFQCTAHFPQMYEWAHDPGWTGNLVEAIDMSNQLDSTQPIYPYIWPQYSCWEPEELNCPGDDPNNPYPRWVSGNNWRSRLNTLAQSSVDGFVIWSRRTTTPTVDNFEWVNQTVDFVADHGNVCS